MGREISCLVRKAYKRKKTFSIISGWNLMGLPALIIAIKVHCLVKDNSEVSTMGGRFFTYASRCGGVFCTLSACVEFKFVMILTEKREWKK